MYQMCSEVLREKAHRLLWPSIQKGVSMTCKPVQYLMVWAHMPASTVTDVWCRVRAVVTFMSPTHAWEHTGQSSYVSDSCLKCPAHDYASNSDSIWSLHSRTVLEAPSALPARTQQHLPQLFLPAFPDVLEHLPCERPASHTPLLCRTSDKKCNT